MNEYLLLDNACLFLSEIISEVVSTCSLNLSLDRILGRFLFPIAYFTQYIFQNSKRGDHED